LKPLLLKQQPYPQTPNLHTHRTVGSHAAFCLAIKQTNSAYLAECIWQCCSQLISSKLR
jgi:hypothetical protein